MGGNSSYAARYGAVNSAKVVDSIPQVMNLISGGRFLTS
jgi:hypothetical protein